VSAAVVISLDFELRWGMQDKLGDDLDAYRRDLEGVRDVVPAMLELFAAREVHATWAFVAALACTSWDEYDARAPAWPRYRDQTLDFKPSVRIKDKNGTLYFAPDLVEAIRRTRGQELGSHTFSHVYMAESGFVRRDALADTAAVNALFHDRWQSRPTSFVFPRNQVAFTDVLKDAGISTWRDNPRPFFWGPSTARTQSALVRGLRLADALVPLGSRSTDRREPIHRASHFVRFSLPDVLWRAHLRRLVREARRLEENQMLHLWWHPHNLGGDVANRLGRLRDLLDALRESRSDRVKFCSMSEAATA